MSAKNEKLFKQNLINEPQYRNIADLCKQNQQGGSLHVPLSVMSICLGLFLPPLDVISNSILLHRSGRVRKDAEKTLASL